MKAKLCAMLATVLVANTGNAMQPDCQYGKGCDGLALSKPFVALVAHRLAQLHAVLSETDRSKFFYACYDSSYKLEGRVLDEARELGFIDENGYVSLSIRTVLDKSQVRSANGEYTLSPLGAASYVTAEAVK